MSARHAATTDGGRSAGSPGAAWMALMLLGVRQAGAEGPRSGGARAGAARGRFPVGVGAGLQPHVQHDVRGQDPVRRRQGGRAGPDQCLVPGGAARRRPADASRRILRDRQRRPTARQVRGGPGGLRVGGRPEGAVRHAGGGDGRARTSAPGSALGHADGLHPRRQAARRKGPVVVYHCGAQSSYEDNSVLCEFLASHGYVVIDGAFQQASGATFNIDGIRRLGEGSGVP